MVGELINSLRKDPDDDEDKLAMVHDLGEVLSEAEAQTLLSALGFVIGDGPAIAKLGGAKLVLASKLVGVLIDKKSGFNHRTIKNIRQDLDKFYATGGFIISSINQPQSRLFVCKNAPLAFFGRYNNAILNNSPMVSVVGSRQASDLAVAKTKRLATELARHNITVVSGGAYGIDQAAHEAALDAGGKTIVVSGVLCHLGGDDINTRMLRGNHEKNFAIIYPFGPFLPQAKFMFVERNRFVSGLADALVIVQGKIGSGTLHTARFAEELNIPIFAIPGAIDDARSYAPNHLLQSEKARVLANFEQFAALVVTNSTKPFKRRKIVANDNKEKTKKLSDLPYLLQVINDHENSLGFDELLTITGLSFADLQKELLDYELSGRIFKRGSQFVLTAN